LIVELSSSPSILLTPITPAANEAAMTLTSNTMHRIPQSLQMDLDHHSLYSSDSILDGGTAI
jgi:hypothetical protein